MDFELNADQQAIQESIDRLLAQHAGPGRAIELNRQGLYDDKLHRLLEEAGFSTIARDLAPPDGPAGLEAALIVEAIARAGGVVASAAQMLVAPAVSQHTVAWPIALCTLDNLAKPVPLRFGAHAKTLLVLGYGDSAIQYALRFWIGDPMNNISLSSAVSTAVWQSFQREGIAIPFPQRVVHQADSSPPQQEDHAPGPAGSQGENP